MPDDVRKVNQTLQYVLAHPVLFCEVKALLP